MDAKQTDHEWTAKFATVSAGVLVVYAILLAVIPVETAQDAPKQAPVVEVKPPEPLFKGWEWPLGFAWRLPAPEPTLTPAVATADALSPCSVSNEKHEARDDNAPQRRHRRWRRRW